MMTRFESINLVRLNWIELDITQRKNCFDGSVGGVYVSLDDMQPSSDSMRKHTKKSNFSRALKIKWNLLPALFCNGYGRNSLCKHHEDTRQQ